MSNENEYCSTWDYIERYANEVCKEKTECKEEVQEMNDNEIKTQPEHLENLNERIRECAMEDYNEGSYAYCFKTLIFFYSLLFWIVMLFIDIRMLEAPAVALIVANCVYCICDHKSKKAQAVQATNTIYLVVSFALGMLLRVENPLFLIVVVLAGMPFATQIARAICFAEKTMRD